MGSMGKKNETRGRSGKKNPFENDTVRRRCTTSKCLLPALEERTLAPKGVCRDVYAEQLQPRHCNKKRKQIFLSSLPSSFFSFLKRSKAKKKKKNAAHERTPNQTKPGIFALSARRRREEPLFPPKSHCQTLDLLYGTRTMEVLKKRRRRKNTTQPPRDDISTIKSPGDRPSTPTSDYYLLQRDQEKLEKLRLDRMTKGCGGGEGRHGGRESIVLDAQTMLQQTPLYPPLLPVLLSLLFASSPFSSSSSSSSYW